MDNTRLIIFISITIIFIMILIIQFYPQKEKEHQYHSTFTSALNIVDGLNTTYIDYSALAFRLNGNTIMNLDASGISLSSLSSSTNYNTLLGFGIGTSKIITGITAPIVSGMTIYNTSSPVLNISSLLNSVYQTHAIVTTAGQYYASTLANDSILQSSHNFYHGMGVSSNQYWYAGTNLLLTLDSAGELISNVGQMYGSALANSLVLGIKGTSTSNMTLNPTNIVYNGNYIIINGTSNPALILQAGTGTNQNYFGQTTGNGGFISDSVNGDLCINSRTGNIRLAGGSQYSNTNVLITSGNINLSVGGLNGLVVCAYGNSNSASPSTGTYSYGGVHTNLEVNNWSGFTVDGRFSLMANIASSQYGLYDCNGTSSQWSIRTIGPITYFDNSNYVFNAMGQQTYLPNQVVIGNNGAQLQFGVVYSFYYYNSSIAWAGGVNIGSFYKASASSICRCTGSVSHYISSGGYSIYFIRFYNQSTGYSYDYYQYNYTNLTGNHASYPCCVQTGQMPAGQYYVYIYQSSNIVTDGNDSLYLIVEITPS